MRRTPLRHRDLSITCRIVLLFVPATIAQPASPHHAVEASRAVRERLGVQTCSIQTLRATPGPAGEIALAVLIDGQPQLLTLMPHSVRSPRFRVRVQDANCLLQDVAPPPVTSYRGAIAGSGGDRVFASVVDGAITAQVTAGDSFPRTWVIQPLHSVIGGPVSNLHVVYPADEVAESEGRCAVESESLSSSAGAAKNQTLSTVGLDVLTCEIACDADVEYYALNGNSVSATVADIEGILNSMSAMWERDIRVHFVITQILIRTVEPDPYDTGNSYALLEEFRNTWIANHGDIVRDVAQLFTGRTLSPGIGIGYTGGGVCNSLGYSIVRSRFSTDYAKRAAISAHELGHLFDAFHCDYSDLWCRIMCSANGGCSAALRSFGPSEVAEIRNYAVGRTCLAAGALSVTNLSLPFADDFYGNGALDSLKWTAVDNAYRSYNYLDIGCSKSSSGEYQKFGTVRTLPVAVHRPVRITYRTKPYNAPVAHALRVEYLKSGTYQWGLLESVTTPGGAPTTWTTHQIDLPPDGYGDLFALRFTGYGSGVYYSYSWYVDDLSIAIIPIPSDYDNDGDVDSNDFALFRACALGAAIPQTDTGCRDKDFDADQDVDLDDFAVFQRCWSGGSVPGNPGCAS